MPWLTVTGTGSWGFGRVTGRPKTNARGEAVLDARGQPLPEVEMVTYPAGVHEVTDEVAACAQASGSPILFVTEVAPTIIRREQGDGPLTWDDIRVPKDGGVYIQTEEGVEEMPEDPGIPLDWPCGSCPAKFPSEGARNRHREFHHEKPTEQDESSGSD